ncbi:hypothetical protein HIM_02371 [Hirsutella minnesotensis 3608]|nr:hypothetical protein HIM_02371 [Hirsutella minnesotensis 3608]
MASSTDNASATDVMPPNLHHDCSSNGSSNSDSSNSPDSAPTPAPAPAPASAVAANDPPDCELRRHAALTFGDVSSDDTSQHNVPRGATVLLPPSPPAVRIPLEQVAVQTPPPPAPTPASAPAPAPAIAVLGLPAAPAAVAEAQQPPCNTNVYPPPPSSPPPEPPALATVTAATGATTPTSTSTATPALLDCGSSAASFDGNDSPASTGKVALRRLTASSSASTSTNITSASASTIENNPSALTAYGCSLAFLPPTPDQSTPAPVRKTSPGLAARLKALGFGTAKKQPSSQTSYRDDVGRLDEAQLRQLDKKLQAASFSAVIARRGRPWKGGPAAAGATSPKHPVSSVVAVDSPQLPEIEASEPLAMDTQKYRMPEHTNGNGTKAALNTRQNHLRRGARPPSPDDTAPPPPPPKDTPPLSLISPKSATSNDYVPGLGSYFTPGHTRPGSIYTISRASFASQLAQLTSLQLPDAESLSSRVSAIRNAQVAATALINAADQIRGWISKAREVIGGLDSEDDVEWAAAGGREGLEEVEHAILRFEDLINVYVGAIEELQERSDIASVASDDLRRAVVQMETILDEWGQIRATLQTVRTQVEIAMEWEELWNSVLGDIQGEMDELSRLVFEMEERRHRTIVSAGPGGDGVDIGDLETIVKDSPSAAVRVPAANRLSMTGLPVSPSTPGSPSLSQDDSSLLALFARMQPLRASLDFLPMRLSVFEARAERSFPTACEELHMRRDNLDASYKKLERDAESLRKELGEDRWVIVFRGAGRQAQKMLESVQRSLFKLRDALDAGLHLTNPAAMIKKIENCEAKKTHYGPAIERVMSIIEKGVKDRLTVNGEILRLHADLQSRWESLKYQLGDMDAVVEEIQAYRRGQHMRDSVSSMLSNDRSTLGSGHDTPGSSPPSSVVMSSLGLGLDPHTPASNIKRRAVSANKPVPPPPSGGKRRSSLPTSTAQLNRRAAPRLSTIASSSVVTPVSYATSPRTNSALANRPRWNTSTNVSGIDAGHGLKPTNLTPSPYTRSHVDSQRSASSLSPPTVPPRMPSSRHTSFTRASSETPSANDTPSRTGHSRLAFRERLKSPGPYSQQTLSKPRLLTKKSMSALTGQRSASLQQSASDPMPMPIGANRPASSMASTERRTSLLPLPKSRRDEGGNGRASSRLSSASRLSSHQSTEGKDGKPKWRF